MVTKEEAEFESWVGVIERTPDYYMTKADLRVSNVPERLWEKLAERCEPVKIALYGNEEHEEIDSKAKVPEFFTYKINPRNGEYEISGVDLDNVADFLIEKHQIKTYFGLKTDYSFNYNGKIYEANARGIVKSECERILGKWCKRNVVDEVFEKIKRKKQISKEEFEKVDEKLLCFENGVYDLNQKKLLEHSPEYYFKHIIPLKFNPEAKCPTWFKFLDEALYPEDIPVMQEVFGFLLYREYFIKKGFIFVGPQDTGKTVVLDTMVTFIGESNKTGLSLQKLTHGSDFNKLSLRNKHLNAYDDLSSSDLSDGGAFKIATGGGYISGEEKFGEYQQFKSFAKQVFATNKIPPVKDNDDLAYFGRWIPFKFHNVPEQLDPFLKKKLWTEEELSGMLNWALEGLFRILENGKFSYEKTPEEIKMMMQENSCPLVAFSQDCLINEDGVRVTKDEMYKVYSAWCMEKNKPRLSKEMLGRQLTQYCPYILATKDKERIWKNARIKGIWQNIPENNQKTLNNDTSDTSKIYMSTFQNSSNNMVDICFKKESELPKTNNQDFVPTAHELAKTGLTEQEVEEIKNA